MVKIVLKKSGRITRKSDDEFKDIECISELSLKKLWLNKDDDIWNQYLKQ